MSSAMIDDKWEAFHFKKIDDGVYEFLIGEHYLGRISGPSSYTGWHAMVEGTIPLDGYRSIDGFHSRRMAAEWILKAHAKTRDRYDYGRNTRIEVAEFMVAHLKAEGVYSADELRLMDEIETTEERLEELKAERKTAADERAAATE